MPLLAFVQSMMTAMIEAGEAIPATWRMLAQDAAGIALTAIWQGLAVAAGLAICLRLAPRASAAHRFALWVAAFGALICLPLLPLLSHFALGTISAAPAGVEATAARPWLRLDVRWSLLIASLWSIASLIRGADLAVHTLRLRKIWKTATPVEVASDSAYLLNVKGLRGSLQLCTTSELQRPGVIGFLAPRILIPDWLLARLTPGELDQIVLHEAEHLRRRDDWTNLLQKIALVLFPLNPALWWIERQLCREREMACDDGVIRITRAPRAYAACLASLAERGLQRRAEALSLGVWHRRPELVRRVHSILWRKHDLSPLATKAVLAVFGCALMAGSVELARCPQLIAFVPSPSAHWAQMHDIARLNAQPVRLVNAAFVPVPRASNAPASLQAHQLRMRAVQAERRPEMPVAVEASLGHSAAERTPAASSQMALLDLAPELSPRETLTSAIVSQQSDSVQPQPVQQDWMVLTTWEQVVTPSQTQTATAGSGYIRRADQQAAYPDNRITITRLIFRILPRNFHIETCRRHALGQRLAGHSTLTINFHPWRGSHVRSN